MNASARVSALIRVRGQAQQRIARPIAAKFSAGWNVLKPAVAGLTKAKKMPDWYDDWADDFDAMLTRALADGARPVVAVEIKALKDVGPLDLDPFAIAKQYIGSARGKDIKGVKDTTKKKVQDALDAWYADPDMSQADLAARLEYWFSAERALLIAVNETTALTSEVTRDAMGQLGLSRWKWQSRQEWNTCKMCGDLHGLTFEMDDDFPPEGSHIGCFCVPAPIVA